MLQPLRVCVLLLAVYGGHVAWGAPARRSASPAQRLPLAQRVERALAASPSAQRAFWGVLAVDAATGQPLYTRNAQQFFVPASNTKLFSTALALEKLGPEHRFVTRILADAPLSANGTLTGDLRLVGGGDPTISSRPFPYLPPMPGEDSTTLRDPLQGIAELANQLVAKGLRRVEGNIVGDDTAYVWEPYPDGWAVGDALEEYGAPVSALVINDNAVWLHVEPGSQTGERASLSWRPSLDYYTVQHDVRTVESGSPRRIHMERAPNSRELHVWGSLPQGDSYRRSLAIDNPALYAAEALRQALLQRGVAVTGGVAHQHRASDSVADPKQPTGPLPGGVELAQRQSPPLWQVLQTVNKVSQNLQAELVLRETARVQHGIGTREAGLAALEELLRKAGIEPGEYRFEDGSGLSRLNLVTPDTIVRLLLYMQKSPHQEVWRSLLPIGGVDGSLASRFKGKAQAQRIQAKTGSLSHVAALSGYATRPNGQTVVFSILVNNFNTSSAEIRAAMDRVALAFAE